MTLATCSECGSHVIRGDVCPHCGTPTPSPSPNVPRYSSEAEVILEKLRGVVAPKYQVRRILGYGGMAGVYLADEPRLGRQVAIKVMSPSLMADPKLVERFGQEARTIAQLAHPNIVTIYEVDDREDLHYFTMTYVGGRTLGQVLSESTEILPVDVVLPWFYQIADALAYAHQRGVVHRDVKPGNVLLDSRGNALVTDFGIAKVADAGPELTRTGMLVGTPAYMSPEQCQSARVTGASDQYSLGAVLYQMLTGQRPFTGDTLTIMQGHVFKQPQPILQLRPDCPRDLASAVERMLAKRPDDRWPSLSAAIAGAGAAPPSLDGPLRAQLERLAAQAAKLEISPVTTLREGTRERLTVRVLDAAGNTLPGRRIDWRPEHPAVVSVTPENVVLATAAGHTTVEAICGNATGAFDVTVEADPVAGIEIEAPRRSLGINERLSVDANVRDLDGTRLEGRAVLWSSSDPEIATVSAEGVVLGIRPGEFILTASTGGTTAATPLTVTSDVFADPAAAVPSNVAGSIAEPQHVPSTELPARVPASEPSRGSTSHGPTSRVSRSTIVIAALVLVIPGVLLVRSLSNRGAVAPAAPRDSTTPAANAATSSPGSATTPPSTISQPSAVDTSTIAPVATSRPGADRRLPETTRPSDGRSKAAVGPATKQLAAPRQQNAPPVASAPPAAPLPGTLDIRGDLPAGATITVLQPDGQSRVVTGRSITLPPGDYLFQLTAPGYENDRQQVHIAAGEGQSWTPALRAVAKAAPAAPPQVATAPPPAPVHDKAVDLEAIDGAIRAFVTAFDKRDGRSVLPLLPSDQRETWQQLLENRQMRNFQARLDRISPATIDGDAAIVDFRMHLSFRGVDGQVEQDLQFNGSAARTGGGWRLVLLRPRG